MITVPTVVFSQRFEEPLTYICKYLQDFCARFLGNINFSQNSGSALTTSQLRIVFVKLGKFRKENSETTIFMLKNSTSPYISHRGGLCQNRLTEFKQKIVTTTWKF